MSLIACGSLFVDSGPVLADENVAACDAHEKETVSGDAYAERQLAYCYWNGIGREKNLGKAEKLLRSSAASGDATAMYDLGTLLVYEDSCKENDAEGIEFLLKSVEHGYGRAGYQLGLLYWSGLAEQPQDIERAIEYFKHAAEYDSVQSEFMLYCIYTLGLRGVQRSPQLAQSYYSEAEQTADRRFIGSVADVRERLVNDERFVRFAVTDSERSAISAMELPAE